LPCRAFRRADIAGRCIEDILLRATLDIARHAIEHAFEAVAGIAAARSVM
jgi:hypothetical protein